MELTDIKDITFLNMHFNSNRFFLLNKLW